MCLFDYLKQSQTWDTSFSFTGASGSIKRWLKFLDILASWITHWIFLTLTQRFTCRNLYTINNVVYTHCGAITCDNSLIYPICTIAILATIDNFYNNNIRMQKWLLRAVTIAPI